MMKNALLFGTIAGMMAMGSAAQAMLVSTAANGPNGMFTVSSTDLLQTNLDTAVLTNFAGDTVISGAFGSSEPKLRDGGVYNGSTAGDTAESLTPVNFSRATYDLNVSTNTLGYDLTSIVSLTGGAGGARSGQAYELLFSVVGDASFNTLHTVLSTLSMNVDADSTEVQVTITDNMTGLLATGVDGIQIVFINVGNESIYREFDVFGTATVPEPSSFALLALASIGLGVFRRR